MKKPEVIFNSKQIVEIISKEEHVEICVAIAHRIGALKKECNEGKKNDNRIKVLECLLYKLIP